MKNCSGDKSCFGDKSCPLGLKNLNLKNVILFILTIKAIWSMFKESSNEVNIEELLLKGFTKSGSPDIMPFLSEMSPLLNGMGKTQLPNMIPFLSEVSPLLTEITQPKIVKSSNNESWFFTKLVLIGIFFYLIIFIKDIIEKISACSMELNVNRQNIPIDCDIINSSFMECPLKKCPLTKCSLNKCPLTKRPLKKCPLKKCPLGFGNSE